MLSALTERAAGVDVIEAYTGQGLYITRGSDRWVLSERILSPTLGPTLRKSVPVGGVRERHISRTAQTLGVDDAVILDRPR